MVPDSRWCAWWQAYERVWESNVPGQAAERRRLRAGGRSNTRTPAAPCSPPPAHGGCCGPAGDSGPGRASIAAAGPPLRARRGWPGDAAAGRRTTQTPAAPRSPPPARGGGPATLLRACPGGRLGPCLDPRSDRVCGPAAAIRRWARVLESDTGRGHGGPAHPGEGPCRGRSPRAWR